MAKLGVDFNGVEDYSYEPVPEGSYQLEITDSEIKESKAGKPYLVVTFEILGSKYAGRKVFENFTLAHPVGLQRLKTLASAAGHKNPANLKDSEELHGLKIIGKIKIAAQQGYDDKNVISTFKPIKSTIPEDEQPEQKKEKPASQNPWDDLPF